MSRKKGTTKKLVEPKEGERVQKKNGREARPF
jgi:hypothetical protein